MKKKHLFFLFTAIILFAAALTGYLLWNKPHKNIEDAAATEINAFSLYNEFTTDSLHAKTSYTGKVLLVAGRVEKISANQQLQDIVLLSTGISGAYINCTMEKSGLTVKEQDSIHIKGICSGYIGGDADMGLPGDVFLTRCYTVK